jgi:glycosyltransferase involved in cell wall biosynthesis
VRILIVGKFPPIEGGVSVRTFGIAHALARRGHDVHVVTNASEVEPAYRIYMRPEDRSQIEATYESGRVTVHTTAPLDRSQGHIPLSNPFITKLTSLGLSVGRTAPVDVVFSFYLEPYAVAGHLISQALGCPHVVRTAGSDAGRLWKHEQFMPLYDEIFIRAKAIWTSTAVRNRLVKLNLDERKFWDGAAPMPADDLFTPEGPVLDINQLMCDAQSDPEFQNQTFGKARQDISYIGIYGKLHRNKGVFALLEAISRLVAAGYPVGLAVLGQGKASSQDEFRRKAIEWGMADNVVQLPFLPHWRVPEFIRNCLAVCCLEQNFPIEFHSPVIAKEVVNTGGYLIASTEMIRKMPQSIQLVDGYNCTVIEDVENVAELAGMLGAVLRAPYLTAAVRMRTQQYAEALRSKDAPIVEFEQFLSSVAKAKRKSWAITAQQRKPDGSQFRLSSLLVARLRKRGDIEAWDASGDAFSIVGLRALKKALLAHPNAQKDKILRLALAVVEFDLIVAETQAGNGTSGASFDDPAYFRLSIPEWALSDGEFGAFTPQMRPGVRLQSVEFDAAEMISACAKRRLPAQAAVERRSFIAVISEDVDPLVFALTEKIVSLLKNCDGSMTVAQICAALPSEWDEEENTPQNILEELFRRGLVSLRKAS